MKHGERLELAMRSLPRPRKPFGDDAAAAPEATQQMSPRCGCDQSKLLAERVRKAGDAVEKSIVLLGSPNLNEQEKVELVAKLLGLARNMKECPL